MPTTLDPAEVLASLLSFAVASVPQADLADRLECDLDTAADACVAAEAGGLVAVWDGPDGIAVCVSALTAERLGLELDPTGHWVPVGTAEFRKHQSRRVALESELSGPDDPFALVELPDPSSPDPLDTLIASETIMRAAPAKRSRADHAPPPPRPTLLLGSGTLWQGPLPDHATCPACGFRRIPIFAYCLICDNYGAQYLLPHVVTPPSDRPVPKFKPRVKASAHAHPLT